MTHHRVVSSPEWLKARKELLLKEKEYTRLRDELARQRRELPWEKVEKNYTFDGPDGRETLAQLFGGATQLIVYHFMFDPEWQNGCKACSMFCDHVDGLLVHLSQRDVSYVTVSRAPWQKLQTYRRRMGWSFKWVSSFESDFNWDFNVTFTREQVESGETAYNYREGAGFPESEAPGISVFFKDESGSVFHTYSSFGRGLESFLGVYSFLDIVPKGRNEDDLPYPMAWVRHKDRYA